MKNIFLVGLFIACIILGVLAFQYHSDYEKSTTECATLKADKAILEGNVKTLEESIARQNLEIYMLSSKANEYQKEIDALIMEHKKEIETIEKDASTIIMGTEDTSTCERMIEWMKRKALE